jgi:cytochrome P450
MAATVDLPAADLSLTEVIAHPYPYSAALRAQSPVFGYEDYPPGTIPGQDIPRPSWAMLRYADVQQVCREHEIFSSRDEMQAQSAGTTLMLANHDRPYHGIVRAMASKAFTAARIASLTAWMADTVSRMLEAEPMRDGEFDFMRNPGPKLPARVMCRLMGVPEGDYRDIRRWANAIMVTAKNDDGTPLSPAVRQQCNREIDAFTVNQPQDRRLLSRQRPAAQGVRNRIAHAVVNRIEEFQQASRCPGAQVGAGEAPLGGFHRCRLLRAACRQQAGRAVCTV